MGPYNIFDWLVPTDPYLTENQEWNKIEYNTELTVSDKLNP